ncbi:MAG TPA: CCA tRNA nucleotidyltransferase [Gemmatimonadota bacterium]|jgi:tRNA nucleotidyltransferase (CCA-adding enzyme)|nr:CCA tRNA nucleotidyltransferase [Gemmatimonadota bacterium]
MNPSASLEPTEGLLEVVRRLREAGHEAWAVGGAVRDRLLGEIPGDWDVATDALPSRVQELFPRTHPVGIEHGTVGVREGDEAIEVTTFRADVATDGRHAEVRFGVSLDEDLARRDFTINAIAWDPLAGDLRDPFGGRSDLERRVLRAVGDPDRRLPEDYLRVLRAFRFAARFDLAYDAATRAALSRHAGGVARLSGERVRDELAKTFAQCRIASRALEDWQATGTMARLLPEVAVCFGVEQNRFHADDVGTHTLLVVDHVHPRQPFLRLVALLHDVGKPPTRERNPATGDWTFPLHERVGADLARQVMERLRFSTRETERAVHLVRVHMDMFPHEASDAAVRRWLRRVGEENVWDLYRLHMADWLGNRNRGHERPLHEYFERVRAVLAAGHALRVEDLAIGGEDLIALGLAPGPLFGEVLATALERVVEDPSLNTREALLSLVRDELLPARAGGSPR